MSMDHARSLKMRLAHERSGHIPSLSISVNANANVKEFPTAVALGNINMRLIMFLMVLVYVITTLLQPMMEGQLAEVPQGLGHGFLREDTLCN